MKKNVVISSILVIALCLSVIAGSTFALFTSESTVNASVSAGNVNVNARVDESTIELGSTLGENLAETSVEYLSDSNVITLSKLVPGDYVNFNIIVTNESDVTVNYRTILKKTMDDGLWSGLVVTFDGVEYDGNERKSSWANLAPGSEDIVIAVKVSLPEDRGNEYQDKSCSFAYTVEALQGNAPLVDIWDGSESVAWYNETDTEFSLEQASQVAGFLKLVDEGNTFEGKEVKLASNLDLYYTGDVATVSAEEAEPKSFAPIGSYRFDKPFKGTFDGQNKVISNLYQNTWELDNGYYYTDCGLGFFGAVEDAYVKNVIIDGADISGESAICGVIAGVSGGETTFENITIKNARCADYQYYSGGIVGWASGEQSFINCTIDESVSIAAQWGDFDNSTGGLIGGCGGSSKIFVKDCTIACRIDAYNDVTSSYQWYAYRRCGMIIGNTGKTATTEGGTTVAAAPQLTCENVTVIYGAWADYTYCEFAGTSWPYVRVQAGVSNSAYSNPRYGHPTDANGNVVVDENHVHNEGEDHNVLCTFDQLYGGGQGVYGNPTHEGVTVIYNNPSKTAD